MATRELTLPGHGGRELRCVLHEEGDPDAAGVIFPGQFASPQTPLLYYARRVLERRGLAVLEVWWDYTTVPSSVPDDLFTDWIRDDASSALAAVEDYDPLVLVGKSIGTIALAELYRTAELEDVPGVWLTPLVGDESVRNALASLAAPGLVVIGTADPVADEGLLPETNAQVVRIERADHALEVGEPTRSVETLRTVVEAMAVFLERVL